MALATWPPGAEDLIVESDFAGVGGKVREEDESVGGVESNAHHVKLRHY